MIEKRVEKVIIIGEESLRRRQEIKGKAEKGCSISGLVHPDRGWELHQPGNRTVGKLDMDEATGL